MSKIAKHTSTSVLFICFALILSVCFCSSSGFKFTCDYQIITENVQRDPQIQYCLSTCCGENAAYVATPGDECLCNSSIAWSFLYNLPATHNLYDNCQGLPVFPTLSDNQFSASSTHYPVGNEHYSPWFSRLETQVGTYNAGGWSSLTLNIGAEYVQVDLLREYKTMGMATRGRHGIGQWVTHYHLTYSSDGTQWTNYNNHINIPDFQGNSDTDTIIPHELSVPFVARYVRIVPLGYITGECLYAGNCTSARYSENWRRNADVRIQDHKAMSRD